MGKNDCIRNKTKMKDVREAKLKWNFVGGNSRHEHEKWNKYTLHRREESHR